jgi:DNA ligase-1
MKAHQVEPRKLFPGKTKWSVKLDGVRAMWDGGITRGRTDVPWCKGEKATGLWSINANVIHAPDYWLAQLPVGIFLDGELWAGTQNFNLVSGLARTKNITPEKHIQWRQVQFKAFELLRPDRVYDYRIIDQPTCKLTVDHVVRKYMENLCIERDVPWNETHSIEEAEPWLIEHHDFTSLDDIPFEELVEQGHEGVMFRNPTVWTPTRSWAIMKMKPFIDSEAEVIGYFGGEKRLLGMIGALLVRWTGPKGTVEFKLSGMTDALRECNDPRECAHYGDKLLPSQINGIHIPRGSIVTFKYRELTPAGVPKEARFWRVRPTFSIPY